MQLLSLQLRRTSQVYGFLHLPPSSGFTAALLLCENQMIRWRRSIKKWEQGPTLAIRFLDKHIAYYWYSRIAWSSWEMPDLLHIHISTNHEAHNILQSQHMVWHAWLPCLAHQAGCFKMSICVHVFRNVSFVSLDPQQRCTWMLPTWMIPTNECTF